jgi:hypothetical protein
MIHTYKCHVYDCPNLIDLIEPITGTYTCRDHSLKVDKGFCLPKCEVCGARGCRAMRHSKSENEEAHISSHRINDKPKDHFGNGASRTRPAFTGWIEKQ